MPRILHFELAADKPERALAFYNDVFGWTAQKWDGPTDYWMIKTGEDIERGINGGMVRRESAAQAPNCNTIAVPSLDEYIARVTEAGGHLVAPKMEIPEVGIMAYCTDTEGNWFGIIQHYAKDGAS